VVLSTEDKAALAALTAAVTAVSTAKSIAGARTSLTTTAMDSLANVTYVNCGTFTAATNDPLDVLLEVSATPGTVAGNKQVLFFAQGSLDGTNFEPGPTSGTTVTDQPNLTFLGALPCNTNATLQRRILSVAAAFGGVVPYAFKVIAFNDSGAALAASGHAVYTSEISGTLS